MGIEIDPGTLPALNRWNPEENAGYTAKYIPSMGMFVENIPVKDVMNDKTLPNKTQSYEVKYKTPIIIILISIFLVSIVIHMIF